MFARITRRHSSSDELPAQSRPPSTDVPVAVGKPIGSLDATPAVGVRVFQETIDIWWRDAAEQNTAESSSEGSSTLDSGELIPLDLATSSRCTVGQRLGDDNWLYSPMTARSLEEENRRALDQLAFW